MSFLCCETNSTRSRTVVWEFLIIKKGMLAAFATCYYLVCKCHLKLLTALLISFIALILLWVLNGVLELRMVLRQRSILRDRIRHYLENIARLLPSTVHAHRGLRSVVSWAQGICKGVILVVGAIERVCGLGGGRRVGATPHRFALLRHQIFRDAYPLHVLGAHIIVREGLIWLGLLN